MKTFIISSVVMCCILLAGCDSDLKRSMGLSKSEPDEYAILKRPALHVPPNFDLTPPEEQPKSPAYFASDKEKKPQINFGNKKKSDENKETKLTEADQNFITQMKKFDKNPNIKKLIAEEHESDKKDKTKKTKSLMETIFGNKS
jgi:hypothetical protein